MPSPGHEGIWQSAGYRLKLWEQNRVKKRRERRLRGTRRTCRCLKQRQEEKGKEREIQQQQHSERLWETQRTVVSETQGKFSWEKELTASDTP